MKHRPFATLHVLYVDLSNLKSVKNFARDLLNLYSAINILILNAGVLTAPYKVTDDGLEQMYQVNHLSHFYLTELLKPAYIHGARVVWLSSESHRFASINSPDDVTEKTFLPGKANFVSILAYNNSKLCNVLGAFEMHRRYSHLGVNSYAVHPGNLVCTGLARNSWVLWLIFNVCRPWSKTLVSITDGSCI